MTLYALTLLGSLVIAALVVNLPFGYLRGKEKKFSFKWFLYIHLPIPLIFVLRKMAGFGIQFVPIIAAGAILGQLLGAKIHGYRTS